VFKTYPARAAALSILLRAMLGKALISLFVLSVLNLGACQSNTNAAIETILDRLAVRGHQVFPLVCESWALRYFEGRSYLQLTLVIWDASVDASQQDTQ
jgi:hypothetical protein